MIHLNLSLIQVFCVFIEENKFELCMAYILGMTIT